MFSRPLRRQRKANRWSRCRQDADGRRDRRGAAAKIGASPGLLIHLVQNWTALIIAGRLQAVRISKKAFTTTHGIRCRVTRGIDMTSVVTSGAFRNLGIDSSWRTKILTATTRENHRNALIVGRIVAPFQKPVYGVAGKRRGMLRFVWGTGTGA